MRHITVLILSVRESFVGLWCPDNHTPWVSLPITSNPGENKVIETIEVLLDEQGIILTKLTHIGVMHGPASYTQLRIFIATANSLAWALEIPLFSFGPDTNIPDQLPELIRTAKLNMPIEPVYPSRIL